MPLRIRILLRRRVGEVPIPIGPLDFSGVQPVRPVADGVLLEYPGVGDVQLGGEVRGDPDRSAPHQLRHFLFTWLKTQGIEDALIQPYSGHASC